MVHKDFLDRVSCFTSTLKKNTPKNAAPLHGFNAALFLV